MLELRGTADPPVDVTVGYVGGGSRGWAPTLMNNLAQSSDLRGRFTSTTTTTTAPGATPLGSCVQDHDEAVGDWTYRTVATLKAALDSADFVVLSTQERPAETMAYYLELLAEYGIYLTVGDTAGSSGTVRAMRAIPSTAR